ncbi:hypothetical protein [Aneurinibacillus aneurinilyticus]|jgi:hypothetical protein|uniref:Uncharacterized protein n=2 Tax=Aneurinibacillus aneurinilyticus TaxID=1391 RepID=A0A848CV47_ANEAE|nr:hypothetical protein [Aneurinibacillus aneurinilyticus]ERI07347.1 hypothetical protein HMPREF0083_04574 [Aneurinibacillus aneurinilyticus ATCC 12856]MCI1693071.1 hypothetical protein [Aneurinibacillus aneurinilyticus]MED0671646.1 hypothetical protein [Aneurinibacillus aneurinilyticus]MED0709385.1 hypothetical protein [Aneurinibacillus aneurinilyticus]MED0725997.1 hypothetical protein [Aneurinibacillus aneurinilyticus]
MMGRQDIEKLIADIQQEQIQAALNASDRPESEEVYKEIGRAKGLAYVIGLLKEKLHS